MENTTTPEDIRAPKCKWAVVLNCYFYIFVPQFFFLFRFLFLNCVIFIAWRFVVGGLEFESSEDGFVALRRKESEGEGQWF